MSRIASSSKERLRIAVGAIAALVGSAGFFNLAFSSSWIEAGASLVIGFVGIALFLLAAGKPRPRWNGASTNTQLQQSPPAILRDVEDTNA